MKHPCIANTNTYEQNSNHGCSPALAGQAIRPLKINFVRMKHFSLLITAILLIGIQACTQKPTSMQTGSSITEKTILATIDSLTGRYGANQKDLIDKGVRQTASLWISTDGTEAEFQSFCLANYQGDPAAREQLFRKLCRGFEILRGYYSKINKELLKPLHLVSEEEPGTIDELFGAYNPSAHFTDDFFANKIAFITILNFPFYSLREKTELGPKWSRLEWAYARLGDMFTARVPADVQQNTTSKLTASENYIANYNIYLGNLVNDEGKTLFPSDLRLISHWGLRDELKSHYAEGENGLELQKMIYQVMKRIIDQTIPVEMIDKNNFQWNPYTNTLLKDGKTVASTPEGQQRYQMLLENFRAMKAIDPYTPFYPTFIQRKFEQEYEIPQEEVEKLFIDFVSSPVIREMGKLISKRLGRPLQPFDIWYDGFKSRSSISESELTAITRKRYPDAMAVEKALPEWLLKLGFPKEKALFIASRIKVEPARGSGHAWGTEMKGDVSLLRTRIGASGMDYKGYNIATHEFGHNVEQTITTEMVDYFPLYGVPNTAFTEALAFIFQKRDLTLLGLQEKNPLKEHMMALDNAWACYEIMGVSLVDMNVWKWLYSHPDASAGELKEAVLSIAREVWNKYYADVFGSKDEPILAIYSHMIENPLYLSAYPIGHLIDFQIEQYLSGKDFAAEIMRIFSQGRLIPQLWMQGAVGSPLSAEPTLKAAEKALQVVK